MLFHYEVLSNKGEKLVGQIDAPSDRAAIENLQSKGLIVIKVALVKTTSNSSTFSLFNRVKLKDIVITSRQIASLFDAQVSAVRVFNLMADSATNPVFKYALEQI